MPQGFALLFHKEKLCCSGRGFPRFVPCGSSSADNPGSAMPGVGSCASGVRTRPWVLLPGTSFLNTA